MTKSNTDKRLDEIEIKLTPKEWAIRFVDEMQKYPSETIFFKTMLKGTVEDSLLYKPYRMLLKQAEQDHTGKKPADAAIRNRLCHKLQADWHLMKNLILSVNDITDNYTERALPQAALWLSKLQMLSFKDALGLIHRNTIEWIAKNKTTNLEAEKKRQIILNELTAFCDVCSNGAFTLSIGSEHHISFNRLIKYWVNDISLLISDVFTHESAINVIQDKYFDGHQILFQDIKAKLNKTIMTVNNLAIIFNEYLKLNQALLNGVKDDQARQTLLNEKEDPENDLTIDIEAIKNCAVEQTAIVLADFWIKNEKEKAIVDFISDQRGYENYLWNGLREEFSCQRTKSCLEHNQNSP